MPPSHTVAASMIAASTTSALTGLAASGAHLQYVVGFVVAEPAVAGGIGRSSVVFAQALHLCCRIGHDLHF